MSITVVTRSYGRKQMISFLACVIACPSVTQLIIVVDEGGFSENKALLEEMLVFVTDFFVKVDFVIMPPPFCVGTALYYALIGARNNSINDTLLFIDDDLTFSEADIKQAITLGQTTVTTIFPETDIPHYKLDAVLNTPPGEMDTICFSMNMRHLQQILSHNELEALLGLPCFEFAVLSRIIQEVGIRTQIYTKTRRMCHLYEPHERKPWDADADFMQSANLVRRQRTIKDMVALTKQLAASYKLAKKESV